MTTTETGATTGVLVRLGYLAYGVIAYVAFLIAFLWAIAFVENASIVVGGVEIVPRTVDRSGPSTGVALAVVIDLALLTLFAAQHSVMAREGFKKRWTRIVPTPDRTQHLRAGGDRLSRRTPVVVASGHGHHLGCLGADCAGASRRGGVRVRLASRPHLDVPHQPLRPVRAAAGGRQCAPASAPAISVHHTPPLVRGSCVIRSICFVIAFWVTPTMTVGHLLFACATTGYIFVGIHLEERDLIRAFGNDYVEYRRRVPMLLPGGLRTRRTSHPVHVPVS